MAVDLNIDVYNELVDEDDPDFAPGIARQWLSQAYECLPEFDKLLAEGRWKELAEKGHFLKGSAAFVGADKAKALCEEIQVWEKLIRPGQSPDAFFRPRINRLPKIISDYSAALEKNSQASGL